MERKDLIDILRVGLKAASPYNLQPWQFDFKNEKLLIYARYWERGFMGNFPNVIFYSLGAFLENLSEGAKHYHYQTQERLLTEKVQMKDPLCEVSFQKLPQVIPYDITHVLSRYTNRKIYHRKAVPPQILATLREFYKGVHREVVDVTNNRGLIENCAKVERVRISNREFNDELIDIMCFNPEQAQARKRGLDIRLLELPFYALWFLKTEQSQFLRRTIGRSLIAQKSAEAAQKNALYGCPLLVAFKNPDESVHASIEDWRILQRIINFLHKEGLSSQIMASSPDLTKIRRSFYTPAEQKILDQADAGIEKSVGFKTQTILTLLRIGYANECNLKALRGEPESLFLRKD